MKFELFKTRSGQWRWRLVATNGKIIANSGEAYKRKKDATHGIGLIQTQVDERTIIYVV